jgi:alpha-acetolactate decarboxylase
MNGINARENPRFTCTLSTGLWELLQEQSRKTNEPVSHIVSKVLEGQFDCVRTRVMRRTEEGVPLVQAAAVQPEFEFHNVSGTLVGFWTPEYAKTFNVPGYHLHFLSADHQSGGHLLECTGSDLRLQIQREGASRCPKLKTS